MSRIADARVHRADHVGAAVEMLPTPCLVVDLPRLERNIAAWQDLAVRRGKRLRPHVKTHKTTEIAALQRAAGATGIAVAKVGEAEVYVAAGFDDVVIAYPIHGPEKWRRAAALARRARITVNADSAEAIRGLAGAAVDAGVTLGIQVEVDSGFHRCGVDAADLAGIEALARLAEELPGVELDGVTTHRGVSFAGAEALSIDEAGRHEGRVVAGIADALRARGLEIREVTAGGTITGRGVADAAGVTEVRAGTYVFNDLMQLGFGSAGSDDLALSIHCTVVSARVPGYVTVDGGSKTFSGDRAVAGGAGDARPELARAVAGGYVLERMSEEHGMVRLNGADAALGDRLVFHPAHACTAVNLSDELFAVRDGLVQAVWPVRAGGKRT